MTTIDGDPLAEHAVTGTVTDDVGGPVQGVAVRALDRDLRSAEVLGETTTDVDGRYEIRYPAAAAASAEIGGADLQVVVPDPADPAGEPIVHSPVRFNAGNRETIDLRLPPGHRGKAETERYLARLEPVLAGVPLAELREDDTFQDLSFLAAETSIPQQRIQWLAEAAVANRRQDVVPLEVYYAWFRTGLPTTGDEVLALPPRDLMQAVKRAVGDNIVPQRIADRLDELGRWLREQRASALLAPAVPRQAATLGDVLEMAGADEALDRAQRDALVDVVARHPADGIGIVAGVHLLGLAETQLRGLRRGVALRRVTGADPALMRAAAERLPALADGCASLPYAALAAMTDQEWSEAAYADPDTSPGVAAERARLARMAVSDLFPQDVLLAPAARRPARAELADLIGREVRPAGLEALVNAYPGLGLDSVIDADAAVDDKATEVDRRLAVLAASYARNAAVPLLDLDYLPDGDAAERLDLTGLDDADRVRVLDTFKAMRRVHALTGDAATTRAVMCAGYASAVRLAGTDPQALAAATGLDPTAAARVSSAAVDRAAETAITFFGAIDVTQYFALGSKVHQRPGGQLATPIGSYFTRIPGYSELFGSQAYCACAPCGSMLSPAAYFVDLMWFVQRRITRPAFDGRPTTYPLRLSVRRPDLWTLPLSCLNTDELVPYLDIVNEVVEGHVARAWGGGVPIGREAVYRRLARTTESVTQPFHLHLERAVAYLGHFDRTRVDVAEAIAANATTIARASLNASVTEWDLMVRPRATDAAFLVRLFGPAVQNLTAQTRIDVQDLLRATGWTRATLGELLATVFVRGANQPRIRAGKRDPQSVQNDVEWVDGLTAGLLDRMHRMWRLWRATGVSLAGLDLLLAAVPDQPAATEASNRIIAIDTLARIARRLRLPIDEACALIGAVPTVPLDPDGTSLFDRLFNLEPFAVQQGRWPQGLPVTFVHPSFDAAGTSTPDNRTLQRLTAGLGVSDAELVSLLVMLGLATPAAPSVTLTTDVLALLFRHAALARALSVGVEDLGRLLRLSGVGSVDVGTPAQPRLASRIRSLDDLSALITVVDQWRSSRVALDDAQFVIEGVPVTSGHPDPDAVARAITERLARERPWEFADTVLSVLPGISETDSRLILGANTAVAATDDPTARPVEQVPDSSLLRLRAPVDPHAPGWTLALPADYTLPATLTVGALAAVLRRFDPLEPVLTALSAALGRPPATVRQLLRLSGPAGSLAQPIEAHRTALATAAYASDRTALRNELFDPRPTLLRLAMMFSGTGWDAAAVQLVADGRAQNPPLGLVFDGTGVDMSWRALVEAQLFDALATQPPIPATDPPVGPDRAALRRVLVATDWTSTAATTDLAAALGTDRARIAGLRPHLPLAAISRPIRRLDRLRTALRLATALGVSGETLRTIVPDVATAGSAAADAEFDALGQGADAVYGVLRTVFPDPADFAARLDPFEDTIRARRRDALVDFLLHPGSSPVGLTFATPSEIYDYFLLDVQMGGCARTSRIVAATQSVQLYAHRVLMGLEAPMWDTSSPQQRDTALAAVRAEWPWRQHYRVWEANRRIFLFPETYLEPELRDDRTPLFDAVVNELSQEDMSDAAATAAYTRYLQGFDELAGLRIAGVFHDTDGGDRLHIFAATSADPPAYYQRTATGLWAQFDATAPARPVFGPWRPLGITIPVPDVAPAVGNGRLHVFWLESAARPVNSPLTEGDSRFVGYDHRVTARFSLALQDGRWSGPQELRMFDAAGMPAPTLRDRLVLYIPAIGSTGGQRRSTPQLADREGSTEDHQEPREGYTLPGPVLPLVNLDVYTGTAASGVLNAVVADQWRGLDLFRREARTLPFDPFGDFDTIDDVLCLAAGELYANAFSHDGFSVGSNTPHAFAVRAAQQPRVAGRSWQVPLGAVTGRYRGILVRRTVPRPATGRLRFDLVVEAAEQPMLALAVGGTTHLLRLGTGLRATLSRRLFDRGIPGLLATGFQEFSAEPALPITPDPARLVVAPAPPSRGRLDTDGPVGTYLREIWLELPYLIAGQLNARQRYAAAQRWYHFLFDPTSSGDAADADRVWRYRGFRGTTVESMRAALTSGAALEAYRTDPFNPHAIARLRPGVHQRAVVMRYVDNLLDWGDALFTEFTRESLNEATMLYVLAADILGPRPPAVGACDDGQAAPTYKGIEPKLGDTSDFLIELELFTPAPATGVLQAGDRYQHLDRILFGERPRVTTATSSRSRVEATTAADLADGANGGGSLWRSAGGMPVDPTPGRTRVTTAARISTSGTPIAPARVVVQADPAGRRPYAEDTLIPFDYVQRPEWWQRDRIVVGIVKPRPQVLDVVDQVAGRAPAFCLPANRDLIAYWDRVEDRLNKIRNCMDLTGARRQPSLFAPEIDPLLLARARAAGISIEDALQTGSGSVPPYRFGFLIERARQCAQSVQAFGNALLGALEHKDTEELGRLRATHERNLLQLRTRLMEWEVTAAQDAEQALQRQREAVDYRRGQFATLRNGGLVPAERVQQVARHTASGNHLLAAGFAAGTAIAALIPNAGSPFSMTYGGVQVSGGLGAVAGAASATAAAAEAVSTSAGLEATFARRDEEWAHQEKQAEHELLSLDRQIAAAQIRVDIATRTLDAHQRTLDQAEDVLDLLNEKFTSVGRYTAMATRAHRLYREAFSTALEVARMAERAFAFERGEDGAVALSGGYWNADEAGLGAADALLLDLQRLEQRFLEGNRRSLEVEQSFSLAMLDPRALMTLRESGSCAFSIPEIAFDLTYPGQYRRRIKAVRVSLPCVTGPHVNAGATLRLTHSWVRREPRLADPLTEVPLRHTTAVATSSAQSDPGVFEFTFRDERYLPFEGAGAVSEWRLEMPATVRTFDYRTISDVVLRIGYTAEEDRALRTAVEDAAGTVAGSLRQRLTNAGLPLLFSCRHDDPDAWRKLLDAAPATPVAFQISGRQLAGALADWLRGRDLPAGTRPRLVLSAATVALVTQGAAAHTRPTVTVTAALGGGAAAQLAFGTTAGSTGLFEASVSGTATLDDASDDAVLTLRIDDAGNLTRAGANTVDQARLGDVLIVLKVTLATAPST
jgi:hypothetical protein